MGLSAQKNPCSNRWWQTVPPSKVNALTYDKEGMMRIVVGYDGSEPARRALESAADLANSTPVTVVSVVRPLRGPVRGVNPYSPQEIRERQANLREARELLMEKGKEMHAVEGRGDPGKIIAEIADQTDADMIAVGTRGQNVIGKILRGSVSNKVLHRADRDVLVIH
jgi:nucleotide-binding universal stress UspA family protein